MTVYIDKDYKCHAYPAEGLTPVEDAYFDGKCAAFVEGHRLVPSGENWTRPDGRVFAGKMTTPWKNSTELEAAQAQYEKDMADLQAAYQEGVNSAYD